MTAVYPWHQAPWQRFDEMVSGNRLSHGLLLAGPAGLGKRQFAEAVAARMLCDSQTACGECKGCHLMTSSNHPDFFVLTPEEDSKQIKVEQIRALISRLSLSSQQGGYKVVIIDPAHAMNVNAQNSLLKTLEEPAEKTLLMLVSSRTAELTATILSRCQRLKFASPETADALQWLKQHGDDSWDSLLVLAAGAPLAALELKERGAGDLVGELAEDIAALIEGRSDPVVVAERWAAADLLLRLRWLQRQVYGLARWQSGDSPELVHRIILKSLQNTVPDTSVKSIFRYLDVLERIIGLNDRTVNQTLAIMPLLTAWADGPRFSQIRNESI